MNTSLQVWLIWCVGSVFAQSHTILSAREGSTALLPCEWKHVPGVPLSSPTPHIEWRTISETVFERRGEESYQGVGYQDRVDIPQDVLLRGNCSLVLMNVRPDDAGLYESYLLVKRPKRSLRSERVFIQKVEFSIDGRPEEKHSQHGAAINAAEIHHPLQIMTFFLLANLLFFLIPPF
ncbi:uncharacterized protein LOC143514736 [Brachyhypopomus gauderio]|uniref:uncharacterized protein LOC143514736 n=1 Tax=Brachyhypopomus gauderio TaxID=698409 RepID=UPI004042C771